ncbi:MAG: DUF308 domain-containing protein [Pseudomonadota bacterium]
MVDTVSQPTRPKGWGWLLAYGLLNIAVGFFAFQWPVSATFAATLVVGSFLLASGIFALVAGFGMRGHRISGYILFYGVLTVLVGVLIAFDPVAGAVSLTMAIMVWLIARGIVEIALGARLGRFGVMLVVLGLLNLVLAGWIVWTVPFSSLTLPGYLLGVSFLFSGITAAFQAFGVAE